jgi:hypothetical protein
MRRQTTLILALFAAGSAPTGAARAGSWVFEPSYYSHSPETGERVVQYQPEMPSFVRVDPTYQESAYRHDQSTVRVGNSADHLHVVQTWGQGENLRPYGEWQFPFRAGATPYGPWGNPQGPWTLPFDSWQNPYGLGRFNQPWPYPAGPAVMPPPAPRPPQFSPAPGNTWPNGNTPWRGGRGQAL